MSWSPCVRSSVASLASQMFGKNYSPVKYCSNQNSAITLNSKKSEQCTLVCFPDKIVKKQKLKKKLENSLLWSQTSISFFQKVVLNSHADVGVIPIFLLGQFIRRAKKLTTNLCYMSNEALFDRRRPAIHPFTASFLT